MVSRKMRLTTCSKQHKKIHFLQSAIPSSCKHPSCSSYWDFQFVFFHVLIPHASNLDLSTLCATLTLIINNFNLWSESDKNLLRPYSTHFNVSMKENVSMRRKIDFLKIIDRKGLLTSNQYRVSSIFCYFQKCLISIELKRNSRWHFKHNTITL